MKIIINDLDGKVFYLESILSATLHFKLLKSFGTTSVLFRNMNDIFEKNDLYNIILANYYELFI